MTRTALSLALTIALFPLASAANAAVTGHCTYEGGKHALVDGAVWEVPKEAWEIEDEASSDAAPKLPELMLVFATFKIDTDDLQHAHNRGDAFRDQAFAHDDSAKMQLTLSPAEGAVTQQFVWISPGTSLSYSGGTVGEYKARVAGKNRMAGHYTYTDDDEEGPVCEVDFDVPVLGAVEAAPPPPG